MNDKQIIVVERIPDKPPYISADGYWMVFNPGTKQWVDTGILADISKYPNLATITDGAITSAKIATGAVTGAKIGTGAVTASKIEPGAVTASKYADKSITAGKLADGVIPKQATDSVQGTIKAASKTALETAEVKIDPATGKLYSLADGGWKTVLTFDGKSNNFLISDQAELLPKITSHYTGRDSGIRWIYSLFNSSSWGVMPVVLSRYNEEILNLNQPNKYFSKNNSLVRYTQIESYIEFEVFNYRTSSWDLIEETTDAPPALAQRYANDDILVSVAIQFLA